MKREVLGSGDMDGPPRIKQVSTRRSEPRKIIRKKQSNGALIFLGVCVLIGAGTILYISQNKSHSLGNREERETRKSTIESNGKETTKKEENIFQKSNEKTKEITKHSSEPPTEITEFISKIKTDTLKICPVCKGSGTRLYEYGNSIVKEAECFFCLSQEETSSQGQTKSDGKLNKDVVIHSSTVLYKNFSKNPSNFLYQNQSLDHLMIYGRLVNVGMELNVEMGIEPFVMLEGDNFLSVIVNLSGQNKRKLNQLQIGQWIVVFTANGVFSHDDDYRNLICGGPPGGYIIWPE